MNSDKIEDEKFLTVEEWSAIIELPERTIRQHLANGRYPDAYKVGQVWRIPYKECDETIHPNIQYDVFCLDDDGKEEPFYIREKINDK